MIKWHRLLTRQLKKLNLNEKELRDLEPLLVGVNEAYQDFDNDINHLETIIEKSSQELFEINTRLRDNVVSITTKLNRIVENIHEVIFETDIEGNWTYLNPAWETLTGISVKASLGKKIKDFFRNENFLTLFEDGGLKKMGVKPVNYVIKYSNQKDEIRWADITIKLVKGQEGKHEGSIGTIVDITKLKEIEESLIKSRDKEAYANKAQNEFLSTMSHEIRTPLNAVIGISHLLLIEDPKEDQLENLNTLKYSSEHLLGLVNNILDFNKIESGSLELEYADFSITHILSGLQGTFQNLAKEKQISFRIKRDESLPDVLKGDSLRLSQIFTNLISNAIKFTEKGKVTLDIEVISKNDNSVIVQFEIIDTGIGIPQNKIHSIFQSFTQATSDTTRKYGGTGLGLPISKKLIALMNSSINVRSKVNQGTTFSFVLEFEVSHKFAPSKLHYSSVIPSCFSLKGLKVLVVEDYVMNIMVIQKFLKKWEVDFEIAENGQLAVELTQQKNYDTILMDLQMPVMNGYDATKQIRKSKNPHNQTVSIYALSASAAMDVHNRVKEFGMNGLISKPFNPSELYQTLKMHLKSNQ